MTPAAPRLGARDRRAIRIGALVLVPALAAALVVRPYVAGARAAAAQLEAERGVLARETALLRDVATYPTVLRGAQGAVRQTAARIFRGPDDLSATAALALYVGDLARRHDVLLQRLETRDPIPLDEGLVTLVVDVRAESDFEGVLNLLAALERGPRLVRVARLTIDVRGGGGGALAAAPGAPGADAEVVAVSATIHGYAIGQAAAGAAAASPAGGTP